MDRVNCTWTPSTLNAYQQTIWYPRVVFWEEREFAFETQLVQTPNGTLMCFVHQYVTFWSPSTLRKIKKLWTTWRHLLPNICLAQGDVTDDKWRRYVGLLGFTPLMGRVPCSDGEERDIFIHFQT